MIVPFLLDLLFEKLLKVMRELTIEEIRFEYWSLGSKAIDEATFSTAKSGNRITQLASLLQYYFSRQKLSSSAGTDPKVIQLLERGRVSEE